jgi:glycosyltransferase involved in cell wall biosynthesis
LNILIFTDRSNFNGGVEKTSKQILSILQKHNFNIKYISLGSLDNITDQSIIIETNSSFITKFIFRFFRNYNFEKKLLIHLNNYSPDLVYIFNDNLFTASIYHVFKKYKILKAINDYHVICPLSHAVQMNFTNCNNLTGIPKSCDCLHNKSRYYRLYQNIFHIYKLKLYKKFVDNYTVSSPALLNSLNFIPFVDKVHFLPNPLTETINLDSKLAPIYEFCFIGHLDISKGFSLILEFLSRNSKSFKKVLVIGDGHLREELENLLSLDLFTSKIDYIPSVSNISEQIQKAKFVVVPSVMNDNEPGVLKIALLNNKFVLGSNRGGIPWILNEVGIDLIFDPSNYLDFEQKLLALIAQNYDSEIFINDYAKKVNTIFSDFEFLEKFNQLLLKCV